MATVSHSASQHMPQHVTVQSESHKTQPIAQQANLQIDLNCDMGESYGIWNLADDAAIMPYISSANIACGFHAGDPSSIMSTVTLAVASGVSIGAHISYPDIRGFGRRFMEISPMDLQADIIYQLGALEALARVNHGKIAYVKPHGALYNAIVYHEAQAKAIVDAIKNYDSHLAVLGLPGSYFLDYAQRQGLPVFYEAFADRNYTSHGTLVSRNSSEAIITDPALIAHRIMHLVQAGKITAIDGAEITIKADSVCFHSDTLGAYERIRQVRAILEENHVHIRAFAALHETET